MLVEGLHAEFARFGHDFFDFVHRAFENQVGDEGRVEHDFHGGDAAFTFAARD